MKSYEIQKDLKTFLSTLSTSDAGARARAVLGSSIETEAGLTLCLEGSTGVLKADTGAAGDSVLRVDLIESTGTFLQAPKVTIEGPGFVAANAIPELNEGAVVGGRIDSPGGIYSSEESLLTEAGDKLEPEVSFPKTDLITPRSLGFLTEQNYNLTTEEQKNLLAEMGFNLVLNQELTTEGIYVEVPCVVEGDGAGAECKAYGDASGRVISLEVINGGSGYTNAKFVFPKPDLEIPPATATAILQNGRIRVIEVDFGSRGYIMVPTVTITKQGIGARTRIKRVVLGHIFLEDVFQFPTVCIYQIDDERIEGTDNLRKDILNLRVYGRASFDEMDDLVEDIAILIDTYPSVTSVAGVTGARVVSTGGFEDLFFDSGFMVSDIEVEITYAE